MKHTILILLAMALGVALVSSAQVTGHPADDPAVRKSFRRCGYLAFSQSAIVSIADA
jgi:hypothetical protein